MVSLDDYNNQKECDYKGEHYYARDNGAVMRIPLKGKRARPLDNKWTFGKPNEKTGYMEICGQRVHRIIAYAFWGEPPTKEHVVDHIDTNRRNNRPENLRWLTRLDNALKNPITRARIENLCGSIDAFLANPSILRGHEKIDPNFTWMREVSREEAQYSLQRLTEWALKPTKPRGQGLGDWIFEEMKEGNLKNAAGLQTSWQSEQGMIPEQSKSEYKPKETKSLTPNVIQLDWKNPAEFPLCPQSPQGNPLQEYMANLKVGLVFSRNQLGESTVLDFGMTGADCLWVMCHIQIAFKTHAITKITFQDDIFYHENWEVLDIGDEPEEVFASIIGR